LQNTSDPFIVLKNHRKKFIRPKAKYVRKVPLPPRSSKKNKLDTKEQIIEYKNSRKMTADSDIELDLEYPEDHIDRHAVTVQIDNVQQEPEKCFFEEEFLDFVMPLETRKPSNKEECM
jgi:hypothetical protein